MRNGKKIATPDSMEKFKLENCGKKTKISSQRENLRVYVDTHTPTQTNSYIINIIVIQTPFHRVDCAHVTRQTTEKNEE